MTITFPLNIVSLNKYDQGDERCLDFELLKNKKREKNFFSCASREALGSQSLSRRVCGYRHGHLGNLDCALDTALRGPVNTCCIIGMLMQAV